jgi:hypothetical protein
VDGLCSSVYAANNAILVRTPPIHRSVEHRPKRLRAQKCQRSVGTAALHVPHLDLVEISMKIAFQRICVLLTLHRFLLRA